MTDRSGGARGASVGDLLRLARNAARAAGDLLLERFGGPVAGLGTKSSATDLVSDADRDAQALIVDRIAQQRPDDGIVGEEGGDRPSRSGLTWVVDPLDGTVNFLFGIPVWCVSVAVVDEQGTLCAVVYDPNLGETFTASRGGGATCNEERIYVGSCTELSQALVGTGFSYDAGVRARQAEVLTHVLPRVRDIRRAGSAALDLCSVAAGRLDGFYEADVKRWDRAAGELIVREAGGTVSTLDIHRSSHGVRGVLAANDALHGALSRLLESAAGG